ncbi:MAG: aldehyde ferredoxin oxidoreductase family protein [Chloroflexota bacterium]
MPPHIMPRPGYTGTSLSIDLSDRQVRVIETPAHLVENYLGGRGVGVALIADCITSAFDAPEMPLVFTTGPLVGTAAPTSGRMAVVSRSPLTGTVFDCSVGGRFGTELKKAGYDFLDIRGIASNWVAITIENDRVSFEDASYLHGRGVSEVRKALERFPSCAAIGRAGETRVRFASIVMDGHYCAGRGGLGAVMGAKRLKAIAVKGDREVEVADKDGLRKAREDIMRLLRASQAVFGEFGLSRFGTAALVDLIHARRMEPTMHFTKTFFPDAGAYSGYAMATAYRTKRTGCAGCPILCKKVGARGEVIPEFETVSHFGALNGCNDLVTIIEANRLCNEYGMDTISAASTIACYGEVSGRWVQHRETLALLTAISEREGEIGNILAEGSLRYARTKGCPELSMSVKGLELPAYDPRGAYGMALAYATSNRGGCHLRAYPVSHEILRKPVATDRFSFEGKARIIKIAEDLNAVVDSLTACKFVFFAAGLEEYAKAVNAVTGLQHDVQSLLAVGERIWNLERRLNGLNGFDSTMDDLPPRFFTEPGSSGGQIAVNPIDRGAFLKAREDYYRIRGYQL